MYDTIFTQSKDGCLAIDSSDNLKWRSNQDRCLFNKVLKQYDVLSVTRNTYKTMPQKHFIGKTVHIVDRNNKPLDGSLLLCGAGYYEHIDLSEVGEITISVNSKVRLGCDCLSARPLMKRIYSGGTHDLDFVDRSNGNELVIISYINRKLTRF